MTGFSLTIPVLREMSNWGPNDPDISRPHRLAKGIANYIDLDDATKDEVDFFADRLMDKLESALMYFQLIMADDFNDRNISQKRTLYEGLYANLWSFYKGRVQNFIVKMGWNINFAFCGNKNFAKESTSFLNDNPDHREIISFLKKQRDEWQTNFGHSRDVAEHSGDYRDGTSSYDTPEDAKRLFIQICSTAETLISYFGSYKMEREWNVIEVNPKSTVFDRCERFTIENAIVTNQRNKK